MSDLETKLNSLALILTNLKKSINNNITYRTLLKKKQQIKELNLSIQKTLFEYESKLDVDQLTQYKTILQTTNQEAEQIISLKLKSADKPISFKTLVKIIILFNRFKMALDIKTAAELATLIPSYDGNPGGVKSFVDAVNLTKTIVPAANKAAAIQIILTKLSGKARNLFAATPANYEDIITQIQTNCGERGNSDLALANLKNLKPKPGEDLQNFTKQVDLLTEKLTETFIREQIPNEVAKKMSQKAAIQTLIEGTSNRETKMMLKIGKFDSLQEAVNVMMENEKTESKVPNAMVLQSTRNNHFSFNNNRYQNRNTPNRNQPTNERNYQRGNPHGRFQSRYPVNRNFISNNRPNQNFSNRNFHQNFNGNSNRNFNRNFNPTRMYLANQQVIPPPTQMQNNSQYHQQGQMNNPSYAQVVSNNNLMNQQHTLPPSGFPNPNYFFAPQ